MARAESMSLAFFFVATHGSSLSKAVGLMPASCFLWCDCLAPCHVLPGWLAGLLHAHLLCLSIPCRERDLSDHPQRRHALSSMPCSALPSPRRNAHSTASTTKSSHSTPTPLHPSFLPSAWRSTDVQEEQQSLVPSAPLHNITTRAGRLAASSPPRRRSATANLPWHAQLR